MHREHLSQLEAQGLPNTPLQTLEKLREWSQGVAFHDELVDLNILESFDLVARALVGNKYTTVTDQELATYWAVKRALACLRRAASDVKLNRDPSLEIANATQLLSQIEGK